MVEGLPINPAVASRIYPVLFSAWGTENGWVYSYQPS